VKTPCNIWSVLEAHADHADMVRSSKHAAAIVYKGQIIILGRNQYKTHPIMIKYGKNDKAIYLHAEIDAIVRCINKYGSNILSKCDLYVLRTDKMNRISSSKPCEGCQKAVEAFGIRKVFHT
jgi:tRNA(Arg) A34 adenosine deaminase TadA